MMMYVYQIGLEKSSKKKGSVSRAEIRLTRKTPLERGTRAQKRSVRNNYSVKRKKIKGKYYVVAYDKKGTFLRRRWKPSEGQTVSNVKTYLQNVKGAEKAKGSMSEEQKMRYVRKVAKEQDKEGYSLFVDFEGKEWKGELEDSYNEGEETGEDAGINIFVDYDGNFTYENFTKGDF